MANTGVSVERPRLKEQRDYSVDFETLNDWISNLGCSTSVCTQDVLPCIDNLKQVNVRLLSPAITAKAVTLVEGSCSKAFLSWACSQGGNVVESFLYGLVALVKQGLEIRESSLEAAISNLTAVIVPEFHV
jgi:hypothetical protein